VDALTRIKIRLYGFDRFGNQGSAQAQNLRDSGIPNENIIVANRDDSYVASAKAKGFNVVHDFGKAAEVADGE
jgi:ketol-acid reductoisomerase